MTILTAIITLELDEQNAHPIYVAECPEVGSVSQGSTVEDALSMLQEATELMLEYRPEIRPRRTFVTTFEVADATTAPSNS
jgi:predicted RNase H-like HicB family nuclease